MQLSKLTQHSFFWVSISSRLGLWFMMHPPFIHPNEEASCRCDVCINETWLSVYACGCVTGLWRRRWESETLPSRQREAATVTERNIFRHSVLNLASVLWRDFFLVWPLEGPVVPSQWADLSKGILSRSAVQECYDGLHVSGFQGAKQDSEVVNKNKESLK